MNLFIEIHGTTNGNPFLISQEDIVTVFPESALGPLGIKANLNARAVIRAKSGQFTCKESYKQVKAMIDKNLEFLLKIRRSPV